MLADIFALCELKAPKLPSKERLAQIVSAYATATKQPELLIRSLLFKRASVLRGLCAHPSFPYHCNKKTKTVAMFEDIVGLFRTTYARQRQAQCVTCQYFSACQFGQQYARAVTDIRVVIDPDFRKKVHDDCPHRPELEAIDAMQSAVNGQQSILSNPAQLTTGLADVAGAGAPAIAEGLSDAAADGENAVNEFEPDTDDVEPLSPDDNVTEDWEITGPDSVGKTNASGHHVGAFSTQFALGSNVRFDPAILKQLSNPSFVLFEIGRVLAAELRAKHKGKFKPVQSPEKRSKTRMITSVSEATRALPTEHAKDDETFMMDAVKNKLVTRRYERTDELKHALVVVLDVSPSMTSVVGVGGNFWSVISRAVLAQSFSIALFDFMQEEGAISAIVYFDSGASAPVKATHAVEYDHIKRSISTCRFNGGGTNILGGLNAAVDFIEKQSGVLRDAEILLITDCGDSLAPKRVAQFTARLGKTVLNTLDVASNSDQFELEAGKVLREISDAYYKADGASATLSGLISLVGGKKKGKTP